MLKRICDRCKAPAIGVGADVSAAPKVSKSFQMAQAVAASNPEQVTKDYQCQLTVDFTASNLCKVCGREALQILAKLLNGAA